MGQSEESRDELDGIVAAFLDAQARGEAPDHEDLIRSHPKHQEALRARLQALGRLDNCFQRLRTETHAGADDSLVHLDIPDHRLLGRIGSGGMGAVFLA